MIKLTKKQAFIYKQRWKRVELVQVQEIRTASISLKFTQLCLLMNSFPCIPLDKHREHEVKKVRKSWVALKKRWENGR